MKHVLVGNKDWLEAIEEHSAYSTHYCSQDQLTDDEEEDAVSAVDLKESLEVTNAKYNIKKITNHQVPKRISVVPTCASERAGAAAGEREGEGEEGRTTPAAAEPPAAGHLPAGVLEGGGVAEGPSRTSGGLGAVLGRASARPRRSRGVGHAKVRNFKLEQEQEKNKILSEALATLATEHHELEQSLVKGSPPLSILSEDEFYDALSDSESERSLSRLEAVTAHCFEEEGEHLRSRKYRMSEGKDCGGGDALSNGIKKHSQTQNGTDVKVKMERFKIWNEDRIMIDIILLERTRKSQKASDGILGMQGELAIPPNSSLEVGGRTSLPSPMFSRNDFSIWSILRKCIGMELSKITMPVIFNEPLSFLQRLTEYMEHTYLIHKASSFADPVERMQCVAAFAVSAVASQWERTGKPFNPLLGETYELVRDDLGFRLISEQVSHHPPISAFHAEGLNNDFIFHGSIYPKLKFWGKSVEAEPKGTITLELLEHNEAYTWTNPTCCVHNIIVGKLWIEQYGNVEITNHKTADKCVLNFKPCGLFGKELHKVEGYIQDKSKKKLCALYGKWTECLYSVDPATFDAYKKNDKKNTEEKKNSKQMSASEESDEMPMPDSESVFVIPGSVLLWRIAPRPPNSTQMYNFTSFAMVLNEVDKEMESVIPKTDCRLRPDIRAMENGEIDQASEEKKRLEEKQRAARKNRSKLEEHWKTRWFHQGPNPYSGAQDWLYSGSYWDRNYFNLPDIY
ncbi:hypothetical protein EI555_008834 [Monodon monoceros]|uniref:Oxysterol-binding protein n=1 Tax=Monodon monoceros TaxID=40151 RepID=A0A4U1FGB1_MONMO|nr:hypothetical protein EI555_008834 [Monodon monoceros]